MHRVAEGPNISVKVLSSKHKHNPILKWYSDLILEFPTTVLIATLLLSLALPLSILHLYPLQLNENPEKVSIKDNLVLLRKVEISIIIILLSYFNFKGFDTRGTESAARRLTWFQLQPYLLQGSRVIVHQPPPPLEEIKLIDPVSIIEGRKQVDNLTSMSSGLNPAERPRRNIDDIFEGLSSVACYEIELIQSEFLKF